MAHLLGSLTGAVLGGFLWVGLFSWLYRKLIRADLWPEFAGAMTCFGIAVIGRSPMPPDESTYAAPAFGMGLWLIVRWRRAKKSGAEWPALTPSDSPRSVGYRLCFSGFVLAMAWGATLSFAFADNHDAASSLLVFVAFFGLGLSLFVLRRWVRWLLGRKDVAPPLGGQP